jgi:hypothetical protein
MKVSATSRRQRRLVIIGAAILLESVAMRLLIVRCRWRDPLSDLVPCSWSRFGSIDSKNKGPDQLDQQTGAGHRQGHLFTTIWLPAASLKAVRFGWWRLQRCPVGKHWSIVTPVKESELSEDDKRIASEQRDIRIP